MTPPVFPTCRRENLNRLLSPACDEQLQVDAPLRERLAAQGQRDVYERFGYEQVIDRIEAVYAKVLRAGR